LVQDLRAAGDHLQLLQQLRPLSVSGKAHTTGHLIQAAQIRAARALLGWNQGDLAKAAKVNVATIRRIEGWEGSVMAHVSTLMRIQSAFEKAGIRFLDNDAGGGIGVRLIGPKT
jgi:DNA-binding XRE family transcriptional regulator